MRMHFADDVQALYTGAAKHLEISDSPGLEALKQRVARAKMAENAITRPALGELLNLTPDKATALFNELRAAGFIERHFTHDAWTRFDPTNRARSLAALGTIEANVALRCRYQDMTPILPALERLTTEIVNHARNEDLLRVCLTWQRLFLALVASMNCLDLFREYASLARAGLTYAWSASLHKDATAELSQKMVDVVRALKEGDGVSASKTATYLRSMSDKVILPVPLSR